MHRNYFASDLHLRTHLQSTPLIDTRQHFPLAETPQQTRKRSICGKEFRDYHVIDTGYVKHRSTQEYGLNYRRYSKKSCLKNYICRSLHEIRPQHLQRTCSNDKPRSVPKAQPRT